MAWGSPVAGGKSPDSGSRGGVAQFTSGGVGGGADAGMDAEDGGSFRSDVRGFAQGLRRLNEVASAGISALDVVPSGQVM